MATGILQFGNDGSKRDPAGSRRQGSWMNMKSMVMWFALGLGLGLVLPLGANGASYSLGDQTVVFENEVAEITCRPLSIDGRIWGWVGDKVQSLGRLYFLKCREDRPSHPTSINPERRPGGIGSWHMFRPGQDQKPVQLKLPQLSYFSNPSFCGAKVAYWGHTEQHPLIFSAMIADADNGKVPQERRLGNIVFETDYAYFLKQPQWDDDCTEATFDDQRFAPTTVLTTP